MREALREAEMDMDEVPVGAVVVKNGVIIARAHNERENGLYDPFAHAEILAMRRAAAALHSRRLTDCTLYVTLEPCPMCAGAMVMANLSQCVFGAFDEKQGCCGSVYDLTQEKRFSHCVRSFGGVLEEDARGQLAAFFSGRRAQGRSEGAD